MMFAVIGGVASLIYGKLPGGGETEEVQTNQVKEIQKVTVEEDRTKNVIQTTKREEEKEEEKVSFTQDSSEGIVDFEDYPLVTVTDLVVYPCRGTKGIRLKKAKITITGIELDREWFILQKNFDLNVDPAKCKRHVSLKENTPIGMIETKFEEKDGTTYLVFTHPDHDGEARVDINKIPHDNEYIYVTGMGERVVTYSEGEENAKWVSKVVGVESVLCRSKQKTISETMKNDFHYPYKDDDRKNAGHSKAALHIITLKSNEDLQSHFDENEIKINYDVWRPNIVLDGIKPWEEDEVREFELVGQGATFRINYNAKRCKYVNYDFEKAKHNELGEPLATLNKIKYLRGLGPIFGCFVQPDKECEIKIGDKIRYTKRVADHLIFDE